MSRWFFQGSYTAICDRHEPLTNIQSLLSEQISALRSEELDEVCHSNLTIAVEIKLAHETSLLLPAALEAFALEESLELALIYGWHAARN